MFSYLLELAKQENEPNRYAHSEEYDELYNELDRKTLIVDILEKQLGCSLEVIAKLRKANYIYRNDGMVFGFIGINFNDEDKLILYNDDECNIFTSDLRLADHKKTWWLKKDKSE